MSRHSRTTRGRFENPKAVAELVARGGYEFVNAREKLHGMAKAAAAATEEPQVGSDAATGEENTQVTVNPDGTISLNFKDVQTGGGFEPFAAGKYPAKVTGSKTKVGKTSGKPYVEIKFTLQTEELQNRSVWRNFSLSEKALWAWKRFLARTGQYDETELTSEEFVYNPEDIMGADVIVDVIQEPYTDNDGKQSIRMTVEDVLADDGSSEWGG